MGHDHTGSTASFSSYDGSGLSDFDPEYEAFASTGREEYDGGSDFSVELGRGPSKSMRGLDDSRSSVMRFQNSVRSSSPAIRIDYPPSHAYPKPATRNSSKRAVSDNLRRDAQLRQANLANKKIPEPHTSKPSRKDQRRSLSEMHARIRDAYENPVLEDERSLPAMPITARTTRFGNKPSREVQLAVQRAGEEGFVRQNNQGIEGKKTNNSKRNVPVNGAPAHGDTGTQQSIVLPDLLNLSELVSGVYEESAPSPARQNRVRTTRFVSPPDDIGDMSITREHQPLNFVPIPEDERSLFVSLKLLQDRAANLELAKSDAENYAEQLRLENAALKAGRSHRKDRRDRRAEPHRSRPVEHPGRFFVDEDETRLSTIDENEIAKLRKKLEAERLARKNVHSTAKGDNTIDSAAPTHHSLPKFAPLRKPSGKEHKQPTIPPVAADETANSTHRTLPKASSMRKSSVKEDRPPTVRPASAGNDMTTSSKGSMAEVFNRPGPERRRRHSDHCANSASHRTPRQSTEDMTSAFILPDITLHHADTVAEHPGQLRESEQRALDNFTHHNGQNCTVCKRVVPYKNTCDHGLNIPSPIPVSDRISESHAHEEDHTLRPAQEPGVALAAVLKVLEDELAHLRMQIATHQGAYYKLDPSMSRRKRKSLRQTIEKLLHDADMKADQIYSLYDVLEGQKKARQHMTEEQLEDTLHSIGIDVEQPQKPVESARSRQSAHRQVQSDSDEEELPWEGIESTADITGRSGGSRRGY